MVTTMKAVQLITNRFAAPPAVMTAETKVMGVAIAEWEEVWTGGFRHIFKELEERRTQAQVADHATWR